MRSLPKTELTTPPHLVSLYKLCPEISHKRKAVYEQMNVEGMQTRYIYCNNDDMGMVLLTAPLSQLPPACAITLSCPSVPEGMTCPELRGDNAATSHFIWGRVGQSTNTWTRTRPRPDGQQLWILGGARLLEAGGQVSQPT